MTRPAPLTYGPLAATHRGRDQRSGLTDRVDAAEHHLRRRREAADLIGLGRAVHAPDPGADRIVATGLLDLGRHARDLERLRSAVMNLGALGDEVQDELPGFRDVGGPEHGDAVRFEGRCGPLHAVVIGRRRTIDG